MITAPKKHMQHSEFNWMCKTVACHGFRGVFDADLEAKTLIDGTTVRRRAASVS